MRTSQPDRKALYLELLLAAGALAVDVLFPLGIGDGVAYFVVMIAATWLQKRQNLTLFAGICTGLLVVGFFMSPEGGAIWPSLYSRSLVLVTIWILAALTWEHSRAETQLQARLTHLQNLVERHASGLKKMVEAEVELKGRLAESERGAQLGFWAYDPYKGHFDWSDGVFPLFDFPIAEGAPSIDDYFDRCHTDDLPMLQRAYQFGVAEKKPFQLDHRIILPDGTQKWIRIRGRPVMDKRDKEKVVRLVGTVQDVTRLLDAQVVSHEAEVRMEGVFDRATVGRAFVLPDKPFLKVNEALCRWTGYSEEELLHMTLEELTHPDDRHQDGGYIRDLISREIDHHVDVRRYLHRDGRVLWARYGVAGVYEPHGRIKYFAVEIRGIEDQKAAEARLDAFFDIAEDMLAVVGSDGYYRQLNAAYAKTLGFREKALQMRPIHTFVHEEDRRAFFAQIKKLAQNEPIPRMVFRHQRKDKTYRWLAWKAAPGARPDEYYVAARDITKQRHREEALKEHEARFQYLADPALLLMWTVDARGRYTYVNARMLSFTGEPADAFEGKTWSVHVHADDRKHAVKHVREQVEKRKAFTIEYRMRRADGEERWMLDTGVPRHAADGAFLGYAGTCIDITTLHDLSRDLGRAVKEMVHQAHFKSEPFTEIRTKYQVQVASLIDLAESQVEEAAEVENRDFAHVISVGGEQLAEAVAAVLNYRRFDEALLDVNPEVASLRKIIARTIELLKPWLLGKACAVRVRYRVPDVKARVDAMLLHRMLDNLIQFAVTYTASDVVEVELDAVESEALLRLKDQVATHFPGLTADGVEAYRRDQAARHRGVVRDPMELIMYRKLTELMGGSVSFDRKGGGYTLTLHFPLEAVYPVPEALQRPPASAGAGEGRRRVLVVEENNSSQQRFRTLLQPHFDLTIVPDSRSVLTMAEKTQFDLFLMNLENIEDAVGIEVLQALRARPRYRSTPAIVFIDHAVEAGRRYIIEKAGFNGLVKKPFSNEELLDAVKRAISG